MPATTMTTGPIAGMPYSAVTTAVVIAIGMTTATPATTTVAATALADQIAPRETARTRRPDRSAINSRRGQGKQGRPR